MRNRKLLEIKRKYLIGIIAVLSISFAGTLFMALWRDQTELKKKDDQVIEYVSPHSREITTVLLELKPNKGSGQQKKSSDYYLLTLNQTARSIKLSAFHPLLLMQDRTEEKKDLPLVQFAKVYGLKNLINTLNQTWSLDIQQYITLEYMDSYLIDRLETSDLLFKQMSLSQRAYPERYTRTVFEEIIKNPSENFQKKIIESTNNFQRSKEEMEFLKFSLQRLQETYDRSSPRQLVNLLFRNIATNMDKDTFAWLVNTINMMEIVPDTFILPQEEHWAYVDEDEKIILPDESNKKAFWTFVYGMDLYR